MAVNTQPTTFCIVELCERTDLVARGYCTKHYQYWWRHGYPEPIQTLIEPLDISDIEASWLAAVLDCEGWIGYRATITKTGPGYWMSIGVGNTNKKLIDRLMKLTGFGVVRFVNNKGTRNKDQWHWNMWRQDEVRSLLMAVLPYLILKRTQAELLLSTPGRNVVDKERRAELYKLIGVLNKRGRK